MVIPPTVSIRSRSWKTARSESGEVGERRRKKTSELVRELDTPALHVTGAQTRHADTHRERRGGDGGTWVECYVVNSWGGGKALGMLARRPLGSGVSAPFPP